MVSRSFRPFEDRSFLYIINNIDMEKGVSFKCQKKQEYVAHITSQEEDFSQWYTDVILKADLVDYSPVGFYGNKAVWIRYMGEYTEGAR